MESTEFGELAAIFETPAKTEVVGAVSVRLADWACADLAKLLRGLEQLAKMSTGR
jgi:hypothetical protein